MASLPLLFSESTNFFGIILILIGSCFWASGKSDKNAKLPITIKYNDDNSFLSYVSDKLETQMFFNGNYPENLSKTLNNDFDTSLSKKDFMKLLDTWFDAYISPYVIKIRISKYIKANKFNGYTKILKNIDYITNDFFNSGKKRANAMVNRTNDILIKQTSQISNIRTPGLDYGIITSSVGTAMIYNAMNEKEKRNQFNKQLNPILRNTNIQLQNVTNSYSSSSDSDYYDFKRAITECLDKNLNE